MPARKDFSSLDKEELVRILNKITEKHNISESEIFSTIEIPVSIFSRELSSLESIVKFLIENKKIGISTVAMALNRDLSTIYQAYNSTKRKYPGKLDIRQGISIPVSIIAERKLAVLESIVAYLKDSLNLTNHEIAAALKRDDRTIWTVYNRALKK